jgi:hypothetical protein
MPCFSARCHAAMIETIAHGTSSRKTALFMRNRQGTTRFAKPLSQPWPFAASSIMPNQKRKKKRLDVLFCPARFTRVLADQSSGCLASEV